jgi:hypothetical protein
LLSKQQLFTKKEGEIKMDFGEVLSSAWRTIWRHKVLWIFGILASCGTSSGGSSNTKYTIDELPANVENFFTQIPEWQIALMVGIGILIALFVLILVIFFSTMGKVGLIRGTQQVDQGKIKLSFGELFSGSMPYFWRVFLLNLLVGLTIFAILIAGLIMSVFSIILTLGLAALCLIPLLCLLIPLGLAVGVWIEQSTIAIVVEDLGIIDGLKRGWEVIKTNFGTMVLMWLILVLVIGIMGGFIIGLPFFLIAVPSLMAILLGTETVQSTAMILGAVGLICYLPFMIVLAGMLRSYTESAWTLTYLRLTRAPELPELEPVGVE